MHVSNILAHVRNALSAYSPLAFKLYGSALVSVRHKLHFFRSLVVSRLVFNLHIVVLSARDLKRLNAVYMRGLRRIHGDVRFSAATELSDIEVRRALGVMAIDAFLLISRLRYLGRLVRQRPETLLGLLHFRSGSRRLPWVDLISRDTALIASMGLLSGGFPAFDDDPTAWTALVRDESEWSRILDRISFPESACDTQKVEGDSAPACALSFPCEHCERSFASRKACDSHARAKHGIRSPFHCKVKSAICPACGVDFRERVRCLNHIGDRRRPRCAEYVVGHCPVLLRSLVLQLDEADRVARRTARRAGHSNILASAPAISATGKVLGRAAA